MLEYDRQIKKYHSNRVSRVLDKLIHPSQTAYVPGRAVHDNLRMFDFYNNYCKHITLMHYLFHWMPERLLIV